MTPTALLVDGRIVQPLAHADAHGRVYEHEHNEPRCFADKGYYEQVKSVLDGMEARSLKRLREVLVQARDALISRVTRAAVLPDPRGFRLKGLRDFRIEVRDMLERASTRGSMDARREIREGRRTVREHAFDPNQPRDADGKWSLAAGAAAIRALSPDVRDNLETQDMPGGHDAFMLYEAQELAPKPSDKLKRVTENNSFALYRDLDYVANVDGDHFGVTKQEDPDEADDDSKYVFAFEHLNVPVRERTLRVTTTADKEELFREMRLYLHVGAELRKKFAFDPNQPRDEDGKWTETGAARAAYMRKFIASAQHDPRVIEAERLIAEQGDSRLFPGVMDEHGNYTPRALAENKAIAESFLSDSAIAPPGTAPLAVIMLGKPGAGKSTMLAQIDGLPDYVNVNPDSIMEKIAGYTPKAAGVYHERSSDIAKQNLVPAVISGRYNAVFDASGKNADRMSKLAEGLKLRGYDVLVLHADVDDLTAVERAHKRFLGGGRYVPLNIVASDYGTGPADSYKALQKTADQWRQYDTRTKNPTITHEGKRAGFVGVSVTRRNSWNAGWQQFIQEHTPTAAEREMIFAAPAAFRPRNAQKWMREKEFYVTDLLDAAVTNNVRGILVNGLKTGELNAVVADKIWTAFETYIGDPTVLRNGEPLSPARLETIVRTNLTDAYNHGRMMEYTSDEMLPFLNAIRYSAVLDERTTECCAFLDGKLFDPIDPDLTDLLPPNHFNCRSIVVPVVVGEVVDVEDFITSEEVGHARGLADAKFLKQEDVHG